MTMKSNEHISNAAAPFDKISHYMTYFHPMLGFHRITKTPLQLTSELTNVPKTIMNTALTVGLQDA